MTGGLHTPDRTHMHMYVWQLAALNASHVGLKDCPPMRVDGQFRVETPIRGVIPPEIKGLRN
jgi:hypothetical protein